MQSRKAPTYYPIRTVKEDNTSHLMPIFVVTGFSAAIFIIVPILIRKGPNQGLIRVSIMLTVFSMWIFWVTIYIAQMNPLMGPRLANTSLAWVGHCWGDDPKTIGVVVDAPAADVVIPERPEEPAEEPEARRA